MIKNTRIQPDPKPYEEVPLPVKKSRLLKLNQNVAFLMLLMVCLASIHNNRLPDGKTVLTAVQQTLDASWQDEPGKITFVDSLVPESLAVFFSQPTSASFALPCSGSIAHTWSRSEPYLSFVPAAAAAYAVADGEVMSLSHTTDDTLSIRIRHANGLESVYYHLNEVFCREGDLIKCGDTIATVAEGCNLVLDVRKDGLSADPSAFFADP